MTRQQSVRKVIFSGNQVKVLDHEEIARSMKNNRTYATLEDGKEGGKVRIKKSSLLPIGKTTQVSLPRNHSGEEVNAKGTSEKLKGK